MNSSGICNLYPFSIDGAGRRYAVFPFMYDGRPLREISCMITLRRAGNMITGAAREKFFAEIGIADKKIFHCAQTHSRTVEVVSKDDALLPRRADGLVAKGRDIGLFVSVADCLPVFLFDTAGGAFSVLHSGWKGTGIAENALALMTKSCRTEPKNVAAVLGPCIRACCYAVDRERAALYEAEFGGGEKGGGAFPLGPVVRKELHGGEAKWYIDMQAANAALLVKNGVRNIAYCANCTYTDENLGSFRREGAQNYTKMIALAVNLSERSNQHKAK
ncbi:MAG: polyphenol oxidase family protein [Spirochaetaceae bacterium]|jgi:YfiH family protein|nr:polyphenol oxidase family protein [Spirochaetaceae bacterium]